LRGGTGFDFLRLLEGEPAAEVEDRLRQARRPDVVVEVLRLVDDPEAAWRGRILNEFRTRPLRLGRVDRCRYVRQQSGTRLGDDLALRLVAGACRRDLGVVLDGQFVDVGEAGGEGQGR